MSKQNLFIEIKVHKWEEYNPRSDVKKPSWFRISNTLIEDPDFYSMSSEEFRAWIYILSMCSKGNSDIVRIYYSHANRSSNVKTGALNSVVSKTCGLGIISVTSRERNEVVTDTNATLHYITRQDITEQDKTGQYTPKRTQALRVRDFTPIQEFLSLSFVFAEREVSQEVQRSWLEAFPEPAWITSEIRKALAWETANPSRRKKQFARFATNWLSRGWDNRRHQPVGKNFAQARADGNDEALRIALARERGEA